MTAIRSDYDYHRMIKEPRTSGIGLNAPTSVCISHPAEDADAAQLLRKTLSESERATILLRTAMASRALYIDPSERTHNAEPGVLAIRRNNLGIKYSDFDLSRAFRNFLSAAALDDKFAPPQNNLGLLFLEIGAVDQALQHLDRAIALDGALDVAHGNRGLAHLERGDFKEAYRDFGNALALDGDDPMHHNNAGVLFLDLEVPEKAVGYFEAAIKLDPDGPLPYGNRGLAYKEMGEQQLASQDFIKSAELADAQYLATVESA